MGAGRAASAMTPAQIQAGQADRHLTVAIQLRVADMVVAWYSKGQPPVPADEEWVMSSGCSAEVPR